MKKSLIIFMVLGFLVNPAFSKSDLVKGDNISAQDAVRFTSLALQLCEEKHFHCAITIVDKEGLIKSQAAMNNASPALMKQSMKSAKTAVAKKNWAGFIENTLMTISETTLPFYASSLVNPEDGVLIKVNNKIIGAIGVSGAYGQDEYGNDNNTQIANAAIRSLK